MLFRSAPGVLPEHGSVSATNVLAFFATATSSFGCASAGRSAPKVFVLHNIMQQKSLDQQNILCMIKFCTPIHCDSLLSVATAIFKSSNELGRPDSGNMYKAARKKFNYRKRVTHKSAGVFYRWEAKCFTYPVRSLTHSIPSQKSGALYALRKFFHAI